MKRSAGIVFILLILLVCSLSGCRAAGGFLVGRQSAASGRAETEAVRRGDLTVVVEAPGVVQARQTALLTWRVTGSVAQVAVTPGQIVRAGQELARLEQTSLPQAIILAQAQRLEAQKALDALLLGQAQRAQAEKAVESAQQALEDARNPVLAQAGAQVAVAEAQKAVDLAQQSLDSVANPVSQQAIDQAYASMLLAKKAFDDVQRQYQKIQNRLNRPPSTYFFFESKSLYRKILKGLEPQLLSRQKAYTEAQSRYQSLLEPADPQDLLLAKANLLKAQAELAAAESDYQRLLQGPTPGEIAVLEAQLADAQREFKRWADGPDPTQVAAVEAQLKSAEAALEATHITAPFGGTVTQAEPRPGDQVSPGVLAFRLDDLSTLEATLRISEVDIKHMRLGQTVELRFDGIPAQTYRGEVIEVPPVGQVVNEIVFFNVKVRLLDPDGHVRPGMTTEATITVDQLKAVLLLPSQALRFQDGQRVVFVQRGDQAQAVPVTIGESSLGYSQVLENDQQSQKLSAGDIILLNPPEQLVRP